MFCLSHGGYCVVSGLSYGLCMVCGQYALGQRGCSEALESMRTSSPGMTATLPQFPHFGELLRAPDFSEARTIVAKLLAGVGEGGVLIAGCPPKEVKIPSRWVPKLGELTARLDDPTALSALQPNFEDSAVRHAADKYLGSFFMSEQRNPTLWNVTQTIGTGTSRKIEKRSKQPSTFHERRTQWHTPTNVI